MIFKDLLKALANYTYPALLLTALLCLAFILIREENLRDKIKELWLTRRKVVFFLLYLSFLLMGTVFGRSTSNPYHSVFRHLFFKADDANWNREIIENILAFVPLTMLFLFSHQGMPQKPFRKALVLAFGTSALIELSQLLFWLGEFQFSDLLWNTVGGMTGYLLWLGLTKLKSRRK